MEAPRRSRFCRDITFEECLKAIAGRREFRVTEKDGLAVVNYDFCFGATFPDPESAASDEERRLLQIRRECRGIIFDKATGGLVALRLHKFFNVDQLPETQNVSLASPHVVCEKLDGAMVSAMRHKGEVVLVSKNGPTELSSKIVAKAAGDWRGLASRWLERGCTPTWEWLDPEAPIVLRYPRPELCLIAIRDMRSGEYVPHAQLLLEAKEFGMACAPLLWDSATEGQLDLEQLKQRIKGAKDMEGCVLKFEQEGRWMKLKSDWYFQQSQSAMKLPNSERALWKMILDGSIDDVLPALSPEVRGRVEAFCAQLFERLAQAVEKKVIGRALQMSGEAGQEWGAAVSAAMPKNSLVKTLLYKAGTAEERAELLPVAASLVARACSQAKSFAACREELDLADLNYL